MIEGLLGGISNILQPMHLLILFAGVMLGFIGGGIPGISGTMLVIILLPVTYAMDPIPAFLLLTSIYATSVFSGAISAILFRTPGTPEAVATVFDGYPMAQKGEGGKALGIAIFSSAIGGVFGTIILIFLTPLLASFALAFSSPEYFGLALLGLTVVASLSGDNLVKGFVRGLFGLICCDDWHRYTDGRSTIYLWIRTINVWYQLYTSVNWTICDLRSTPPSSTKTEIEFKR